MRKQKFTESSALLCENQCITALIVFISFICSRLFMEKFQNDAFSAVKDLDNAAGAMIAIIVAGGLVGILLISCSIVVPLIIPLFSNFIDNLKSLIGLVIVNFGIGYYLFLNFTLQLALYYLLTVCTGMYFSLYFRYTKHKNAEMNV
ncbi:hypothetical protein MKZ25_11030 [Solibacillus sp. FSL W7-1464]|uniref:hypothetical protein n=1 Tax=Solibacillus sp. FSL W7-1464 TaxID=2921706 RepID=UPI0030FC50F1